MKYMTEGEALRGIDELCMHLPLQPKDVHIFQGGLFSQWKHTPFTANGRRYANAEQFMHASKARYFKDEDAMQAILNTESPKEAKAIGRRVQDFSDVAWRAIRYEVVWTANLLKFSQSPECRQALLDTRHRFIIEANPNDEIWSAGRSRDDANILTPINWNGLNLLGFALMSVRDLVRLVP